MDRDIIPCCGTEKDRPGSSAEAADCALFRDWLRQTLKPLRYPPDRKRVRAELTEHFEECVDGLQHRGMAREQAEREAVKRLGSPDETGELLRQVHKPWLGWALRVARILLALAVVACIASFMSGSDRLRFFSHEQILEYFSLDSPAEKRAWSGTEGQYTVKTSLIADRSWRCSDEVQFGNFRVSVLDAFFRVERIDSVAGDGKLIGSYNKFTKCLLLQFRGEIWNRMPYNLGRMIRIVDDSGVEHKMGNYPAQLSVHSIRTQPDTYVMRVDFFVAPDQAERLSIRLGQGEDEKTLELRLGKWESHYPETLPPADADTVNGVWTEKLNYFAYGEFQFDPVVTELGSAAPVEGRAGAVSLAVPRAVMTHYEQDPREQATPEGSGELVDCTLVFRGDLAQLPLLPTVLMERLRIVNSTPGSEASEIGAEQIEVVDVAYCRDLVAWRLAWRGSADAASYALQYRQGENEPACTLNLDVMQ